MSMINLLISQFRNICNTPRVTNIRSISVNSVNYSGGAELSEVEKERNRKLLVKRDRIERTKEIPVESSIKYLSSEAYKTTYGDKLVWEEYRRNHKGAIPPRRTRKTCIRKGIVSTGNPCPICRDEYLVLDHRNLELLKQFISPHSGEVLSFRKTGLCQTRHQELLIAVERAMDYGLITFDVPFREFDYSEYFSESKK